MVIKIYHIMKKIIQRYFTEQGADDAINDYNYLIGGRFCFDNSGAEYELKNIVKQKNGCGFDVRFHSYVQGIDNKSIYDFMIINKISGYDFDNYESCSK